MATIPHSHDDVDDGCGAAGSCLKPEHPDSGVYSSTPESTPTLTPALIEALLVELRRHGVLLRALRAVCGGDNDVAGRLRYRVLHAARRDPDLRARIAAARTVGRALG